MKGFASFRFRCLGKCGRAALGAVVLLPSAWVALLAVVPTECARRAVVERLGRASGQKVTLGRVSVGLLGGVALRGLEVGDGDDPWLKVGVASIDVSLWHLLLGRVEPTAVDVREARVRVLRHADGSLELADLLRPGSPSGEPAKAGDPAAGEPAPIEIRVREATVLVVDEPTGTRLEFTNAEGRGSIQGRSARVTELNAKLNGGSVLLAAQVDGSGISPRFEGQARLRDVKLGDGGNALRYLVPVLPGAGKGNAGGTLALDLYLRGQGDSRAEVRETLVGQGTVTVDPVSFEDSRVVSGLGELFDLSAAGKFGDLRADLTVKGGRVRSDDLTVNVGRVPVVLAGWTDFDGRVEYRLRTDRLVGKLSPQAMEVLKRLKPGSRLEELSRLKIEGTVDALSVTSDGVPVGRGDGRRRLNDLARKPRDPLRR